MMEMFRELSLVSFQAVACRFHCDPAPCSEGSRRRGALIVHSRRVMAAQQVAAVAGLSIPEAEVLLEAAGGCVEAAIALFFGEGNARGPLRQPHVLADEPAGAAPVLPQHGDRVHAPFGVGRPASLLADAGHGERSPLQLLFSE